MAKDVRTSRNPKSGDEVFASGDSGTSKDLIDLRGEQTLSPSDYVIAYDGGGTTEASVSLYDDESGTTAGNVTGRFEVVEISPGDTVRVENMARDDIENDVVAVVENNDADVSIVFGGHIITG